MKRNIFVGNLAWATDDVSLADHFQQCGEVVRAKVMTDMHTGKSRGFAFVTMGDEQQHDEAIRILNNTSLDGRNIVVAEAKEKPVRAEGRDSRGYQDRGDRGFRNNRNDRGYHQDRRYEDRNDRNDRNDRDEGNRRD